MAEPLFAAFLSRYAFAQNPCCKVAAHFPSVFEAVRNNRDLEQTRYGAEGLAFGLKTPKVRPCN